jgi:hypothetical protein
MINFLTNYKWYRKWKGGIWFKVQVTIPEYWAYWTTGFPCCVEIILKTEDYATLKMPLNCKLPSSTG